MMLFVNNLYRCGTDGESLLYINNRLENRTTVVEWDKQLVGPIRTNKDLNKEEEILETSTRFLPENNSPLLVISAIGLADDTVLISNCPHSLLNLLDLSLDFCKKYHVQLCVDKTKLLV